MPKKKKKSSSLATVSFKILGKLTLFIIMSPYYISKGFLMLFDKTNEISEKKDIIRKRKQLKSNYEEFKIIKESNGNFKDWFINLCESDSKIGIIIGSRGSGKTAFGLKLIENIYSKFNKDCFAMGFKEDELPIWIKGVSDIKEINNNSVVLIDEGGILFSSRSSMSSANKLLSSLMLVARHKNMTIIFISQNSSNLEVNILRQADFLALKSSSLLQKDFERKIIQKIYSDTQKDFEKYSKEKGLTHIYAENYKGFVSNPLPSFWKESISKSFSES
jgi:hypothetical protein